MASFSISPDRMTLTLLFFAFFHYIFFLPPSLSPFVFDSGFLYNLIDSTDKKLWIRTINSHVRIIHQGYRSHVRRDFIEIWNFVFQRSFQVLSFLLKFHRRITFFFFFLARMDLDWFLLSSIFSHWGLIEYGRKEES